MTQSLWLDLAAVVAAVVTVANDLLAQVFVDLDSWAKVLIHCAKVIV